MTLGHMALKAVLFDFDGTLVNSEEAHYRMWADVLKAHGVTFSLDDYKNHYAGIPSATNAASFVTRYGLDVSADALFNEKIQVTHAYVQQYAYPLMPYALETLEFLKQQGFTLAVVTGADRISVTSNLHAHGLSEMFATVVSADDVLHNKPAPDVYLLAMAQLGLGAAACVAVEDSEHGLAAAHAAGMACLAIPNDMSAGQDFGLAAAVLGGLNEVEHWVMQHRIES